MFIVPLNSLIQFQAPKEQLGTVLAGNNWIQNVAMMTALAATVAFSMGGIGSVGLFYLLALLALVGTGYTVRKLPHSLARILAMAILKRRYRVEVIGFDNIPQAGATLLLGNHISWIDWALVQIACPRPIRFVMLKRIYETWYLKPFFKAFGVVPIAAGQSQQSLATINGLLKSGECVCLFPEGAISRNGHLGKFHTGYERTLEGVEEGVIVPFYLHGLWGSSLSRADEGLRHSRAPDMRRDLIVAFGEPLPLATRAQQLKQKVFELSITAWDAYSEHLDPVPLAWLRAARREPDALSVADSNGTRLRNRELVGAVARLGRALKFTGKTDRHIGVLLPPGTLSVQAIMAILLRGRAVVPMNYTAAPAVQVACLQSASVQHVMTSREFVDQLGERGVDTDSLLGQFQVHYVEDLLQGVPAWQKAIARLQFRLLPSSWLCHLWGHHCNAGDAAAILFSHERVGAANGVVLSHRNIMVNCKQMSDVLNTQVDDVIASCLPSFHPMGLTLTTLMPLVEGIPVVCHPDPTDVLGIAKAIARYSATLLPGAPGTLGLFARNKDVHPLMLNSLRLVVSGAEPLSDALRQAFELKFGKRIYEGFGSAETTTVATVNIPDAMDTTDWKVQQGNIHGTMGMPLPGTGVKIMDALSGRELPLDTEGQVWVCGSQVMSGYLEDTPETAATITELEGKRWLNTGRSGRLTDEGFLVVGNAM
jgi:acyl-[acyl-carrier-protein]-phospholipid O-acyltransferase/long-chain-fatty-acid--[acyl-carrier-protein] ligase